VEDLLGKGTFG